MKPLSQLLKNLTLLKKVHYKEDEKIKEIHFDSRQIQKGDIFVAIQGTQADGHNFIDQAIEKGAKVIVCAKLPEESSPEIIYILVPDTSEALGWLASNYYDNPSHKLKLVAITGTNGKTTTATLLYKLYMELGYMTGLLSTVQNQIGEKVIIATHTTPDALQLNALLAQMLKAGCTHCFMEASSHAIDMRRVAGLKFAGAVFSNISHDHLDYHQTFDNYIKAKKKLFDDLEKDAFALSNIDDKRGIVVLQNTKAQKKTYALLRQADFKGKLLDNTIEGLQMEIDQQEVWFRLIGNFNAYNLLAVYATARLLEDPQEEVLKVMSGLLTAPGRFEQIISPNGTTAIVDYAHTPDALQNVLNTIQGIKEDDQRVISIVGCGGDRDKTKRPIMAKTACQLSDITIFTADNPRTEDPLVIIDDMIEGISPIDKKKVITIVSRKEAIQKAIKMATRRDIILVAGKGHEDYQEINGVKSHFDDKEEVIKAFENKAEA